MKYYSKLRQRDDNEGRKKKKEKRIRIRTFPRFQTIVDYILLSDLSLFEIISTEHYQLKMGFTTDQTVNLAALTAKFF